jgi:hypothetical protein
VTLKRSLLLAALALGLVVVLGLALRSERVLTAGLPLRIVVASETEAWTLAGPSAVVVLGTGSMAPYIPSAPAGADPLKTIAAYAVVNTNLTYKDITPGALVIYSINYVKGSNTMHQAALLDASGWIMTGLGNKEYENRVRVTSDNFVGIVSKVYVWKP